MNIHEYQARYLLSEYDISIPDGETAEDIEQAVCIYRKLNKERVVIKAQVHSGGRGKAGGVKIAENEDDVRRICSEMFGSRLITRQTGKEGKIIEKVLLCEASSIDKELYFALTVDRNNESVTMIVSQMGGIDIEEVSSSTPDKIKKIIIPTETGMKDYLAYSAADFLGLNSKHAKEFCHICRNAYRLFIEKDCSLIEMNPLAISGDELMPVDIKINFDDNGLFRHPEIIGLRDEHQENEREAEAFRSNVTYVALDGNIGCLVNGAGLAMATMDAIALHGGKPANFLDIGGGASAKRVEDALRIILMDQNVKGIIINIFGGITSCISIAEGIVEAVKAVDISIPLVVRLEGNGAKEGKEMLKKSPIKMTVAQSMDSAAVRMIEMLKEMEQ